MLGRRSKTTLNVGFIIFDQADLLIFRRLGLHVCLPEAASLVLSINPAKLIMLLRGR